MRTEDSNQEFLEAEYLEGSITIAEQNLSESIGAMKISLDSNLNTVTEHLDSVRGQIEAVDQTLDSKLNTVNDHLDSSNGQIEAVDSKLKTVNEHLHSMNGQVEAVDQTLESKLNTVNEHLNSVRNQVEAIDSKLNTVNQHLKSFKNEMSSRKAEAKMRSLEWAIENVERSHSFIYYDRQNGGMTGSIPIAMTILFQFRKNKGCYLSPDCYMGDYDTVPGEPERKRFREKIYDQIEDLTAVKPRIVKYTDGRYAIFYS